jgi:hypothetical protein
MRLAPTKTSEDEEKQEDKKEKKVEKCLKNKMSPLRR